MANLNITNVRPVKIVKQSTAPVGEAVTVAAPWMRLNATTGNLELGNATTAAEAKRGGIALQPATVGEAVTIVEDGVLDVGEALDALAFDAPVFLSNTDGMLADAAGTVSVQIGKVVPGWAATTADKLLQIEK